MLRLDRSYRREAELSKQLEALRGGGRHQIVELIGALPAAEQAQLIAEVLRRPAWLGVLPADGSVPHGHCPPVLPLLAAAQRRQLLDDLLRPCAIDVRGTVLGEAVGTDELFPPRSAALQRVASTALSRLEPDRCGEALGEQVAMHTPSAPPSHAHTYRFPRCLLLTRP